MSDSNHYSDYRHPRHEEAAQLLRAGVNVRDVAKQIGMARSAVQRVRNIEGISIRDRIVPIAEKLASCTVWDDEGNHATWNGKRNHGTPVIRHRGREMSAASVAYEVRTGRKPVGQALSECEGIQHCMNPAHILDQEERQLQRRQLRALFGYGPVGGFCQNGHDQTIHGGVEPDLKTYCRPCNTARRERNRKAATP